MMMIGCEDRIKGSGETSDAQLVQSIIEANKTAISMDDLPSQSRTVVEQDYNEYIDIDAKIASGLGYEVSMGGKWHKTGDHAEVYFNLEGRKLNPYLRDKDGWDKNDKDGWKCFELDFPVTFVMPDGSTIAVADKEDWDNVKGWYDSNPDSEERPALQYPVDISYRDGTNQTVINDEEMGAAKRDCWDKNGDKD